MTDIPTDKLELLRELDSQREVVRSLKAEKASSSTIAAAVERLKKLKLASEQLDPSRTEDEQYQHQQQHQDQDHDAAAAAGAAAGSHQVVTPWDVQAEGVIDYDRLIEDFGSSRITPHLMQRLETVTGGVRPHHFFRRGLFFSHRDLGDILDAVQVGKKFYLYTGRGPSSESMHFGHLIPFMMTKWLQDTFKVPLVIQMTDDEKFLWKDMTVEEARRLTTENAKDIIALGFDPKLTFIFSDLEYLQVMYPNILRIQKSVSATNVKQIFGFQDKDCIGKFAFPAVQAAPAFPTSFPHIFGTRKDVRCLIPCAIDQDPYFRMTRDVAPKLGFYKCSLVHSMFFPALQGPGSKMSGSVGNSCIYLTDTASQIKNKINRYAFSGGGATKEEQQQHGANLDVDVPFQWLRFFLEDDSALEDIRQRYSTGKMLTGEIKGILIEKLQKMAADHQAARAQVTDEMVQLFMTPRPLPF